MASPAPKVAPISVNNLDNRPVQNDTPVAKGIVYVGTLLGKALTFLINDFHNLTAYVSSFASVSPDYHYSVDDQNQLTKVEVPDD